MAKHSIENDIDRKKIRNIEEMLENLLKPL